MKHSMPRLLRMLADTLGGPEDISGAKKNRSHTKKGPGRMPFRRKAVARRRAR